MGKSAQGVLQAFLVTGENGQKRREIKFSKAINACSNPDGSRLTPEQGLMFAILLQAIKDVIDYYNYRISRENAQRNALTEHSIQRNALTENDCRISKNSRKPFYGKTMCGHYEGVERDGRHAIAFFMSNGLDKRRKRRIGETRYRYAKGEARKVTELWTYGEICEGLGINARRLLDRLAELLTD